MSVEPDAPAGPDFATPLGRCRLLAADTASPYLLPDDALLALLAMEGVDHAEASTAVPAADAPTRGIRLAAASALETIASSEAMVSKKIRTQDLATDGPAIAAELRARASGIRARVEAEDLEEIRGHFAVVEHGGY